MRMITALAFFCLAAYGIAGSEKSGYLDKNVSVYEGEKYAYVIYPPNGYQTIYDEAMAAGYSFSFIPLGQKYKTAKVAIDVNILRLEKAQADNAYMIGFIKEDIKQLKKHFGKGLSIRTVDSVFNDTHVMMPTLYVNDTSRFVPTVMISYFNGVSEVIIFQLSINRNQPRPQAEEAFLNCIEAFKSLVKGDINERNKKLGSKNK
ncbi:MAG TPA: hypothetical protein VHP63_05410 [candidate division Zixibacteria bacterium]|nr:hypothetical protein [candidate division Zixibacteria bacterium]